MGHDGGDVGADVIALDQGEMPHTYPRHVRDGVEWAGSEDAGRDPELACPRARLGLRCFGSQG